ncbi:Alpha-enolase [Microtus ochrogaster]|uniref:phosphopyruvate hydratase n=1 Tax=Microtus ochrogaster TaxID=79684 RepID=A0A8J6GLC3_MICOH|nr:Alpha-enolase [Microtus ochrogaster]
MTGMDSTEYKSKFVANAVLGVPWAACKAGTTEKGVSLYYHIADFTSNPDVILSVSAFIAVNRGSHTENKLAMQEFIIFPVGVSSCWEAVRIGAEVYNHLKNIIKEKYGKEATNVSGEGSMDMAVFEFFRSGKYDLDFKSPDGSSRHIIPDQLADLQRIQVVSFHQLLCWTKMPSLMEQKCCASLASRYSTVFRS